MSQFNAIHSLYICLFMLLPMGCGDDKGDKENSVEDPEVTELVETVEKEDEAAESQKKKVAQSTSGETIPDDKAPVFDPSQALISANGVFAVKVLWLKGPVTGYDNDVELTFAHADLTKIEQVEIIRFRTWMEIHGHGGDDRKVVIERDKQYPHVFHIRNFFPIMAGPWSLRITAGVDGVEDNIDIPFKI